MIFRKASAADISAVEEIYNDIHTKEEKGGLMTGWIRGIYPMRATAEGALERGELFVLEDKGRVVGAGIINQDQAEAYTQGQWVHELPPDRVCVLHTLVVSPAASKKGYGKAFVCFYEEYARKTGCKACRMDTLEWNSVAPGDVPEAGIRGSGHREHGVAGLVQCEHGAPGEISGIRKDGQNADENWFYRSR